jgi:hypothetical protein
MAPPRHSPRGSDLQALAALLRKHRPQPTPLQLDQVKRRVVARHERTAAAGRWTGWRTRLLLASAFALAFVVNAFGVPGGSPSTNLSKVVSSATQVGGGDAAVDQYLPEDNTTNPPCQTCATGSGASGATIPAVPGARRRLANPRVTAARLQRVLLQRGVILTVSSNFAGRLVARGTIALPQGAARSIRLKPASRRVAAGQRVRVKLGLTKKALRAVRRALAAKRRLRARLTVVVTSRGGQRKAAARKVTLIR